MKKFNATLLEKVAYGVAGVVLCGALAYYNFVDKPIEASIGVGSTCPDFTVDYITLEGGMYEMSEQKFTLSENQGKITVLNFWETWCVPCVNELPEFNEFKEMYSEVDIIAIVPKRLDVIEWMNGKKYQSITPDAEWTEFSISFAMYDAAEEDLYEKLGGYKRALPMTVIVDENGVIVYHTEGSMHLEDLQEIIVPLLENTEQTDKDTLQE
jgi:thiol-disulfide isomerase/thioredoxin